MDTSPGTMYPRQQFRLVVSKPQPDHTSIIVPTMVDYRQKIMGPEKLGSIRSSRTRKDQADRIFISLLKLGR